MNSLINKITTISVAFTVIALTLFAACTDRIDITTEGMEPRLVIYGYITSDTTQHSIRITRSGGYFDTTPPEGVSNAIVTITSEDETYQLTENPQIPGLYQTPPNTFGTEGKTYSMHVTVDSDDDGEMEEFEASSYMPYSSEVDSIQLQASTIFDDMIEVLLYGKISDKNERNYFSFHTYRNNVAVNDSLVGFFILDDEYLDKKEIKGLSCFYLDQEDERSVLTPGDTLTLRLDIFTKEYADFMDNAQTEVDEKNPIFSGPPANVETNIKSKYNPKELPVVGFFSAFSGRETSTIYKPE